MIRPSLVCAAAAFTCLFSPGRLSAQNTVPNTVTSSTGNATDAVPIPATAAASKLPNNVNTVRRLVQEVRENTDNIQSKGEFGAQLWLVQGQEFFEDWRKPGTPGIDPVTIVPRGQTISTVVILNGAARDNKGLCNVHYDLVVKRPNGTIYNRRDDLIGWQDLAPATGRPLMLGRDFVAINLGPDDPAGIYSVEATVRDNVGRQDLTLRQTFVVE